MIYPLLKNMLGVNVVLAVMNFLFMHQLPHPKLDPIVPSVRRPLMISTLRLRYIGSNATRGTGFMLC